MTTPFELMTKQEQAEVFAKAAAADKVAREKRDAEHTAQQAQLAAAHRERGEAKLKAPALDAWLRSGGDEAGFDEQWPTLKVEIMRQRAVAASTGGTKRTPAESVARFF